jgi:hypothetical protein
MIVSPAKSSDDIAKNDKPNTKRIPRTVNPRPAEAWQASVAELLPDSFSFVGLPCGSLRFGQNVMN